MQARCSSKNIGCLQKFPILNFVVVVGCSFFGVSLRYSLFPSYSFRLSDSINFDDNVLLSAFSTTDLLKKQQTQLQI